MLAAAAISKEELEPKKDHHLIFWTQTTILEQQQREQKQRSAPLPHHNECFLLPRSFDNGLLFKHSRKVEWRLLLQFLAIVFFFAQNAH